MSEKTFLDKIIYKYVEVGIVEKDGKQYRKLRKVKRFASLQKKRIIYLYIAVIVAGVLLFINFVYLKHCPSVETNHNANSSEAEE
jgi:hypothetical protein